jgi:hypothetical protein
MRQILGGKNDAAQGVTDMVKRIMQKEFNAQTMKKELQGRLVSHCKPEQMSLALQELQTPFIADMLNLEAASNTPAGKLKLQRYMKAMLIAPPSDARMSAIQAFDEMVGFTEFETETLIAITRGMMTGLAAPPEIIAQMGEHRSEIKAQAQNAVLLSLSCTYRTVSRADLERYAKAWSSQPLKGFNDAIKKSFMEMMEDRARAMGEDMKTQMASLGK